MPLLVAKAELPFVRLCATRQALGEIVGAGPILGVQQPLPCADVRLDLVLGVAEHLLPPR